MNGRLKGEKEKLKEAELSSLPAFFCLPGADFHGVALFGVVTNKQVAEVISLTDDESVYLSRRLNSSLVSQTSMTEAPPIQMKLFMTTAVGFTRVHSHLYNVALANRA